LKALHEYNGDCGVEFHHHCILWNRAVLDVLRISHAALNMEIFAGIG
jgi:hypothetical protein